MSKRHRPKVRKQARARDFDRPGFEHRLECTCGHHTDWTGAPYLAEAALADHLDEVAAPEAERCREPKTHRMPWWEFCPVCAYQVALFDL